MKTLFIALLLISFGMMTTSCQPEEIEPNQPVSTTPPNNTTSNWDPFIVQHKFYVDYYIACGSCNKNDIIDTIFYRNITTGDSTLIVVDDQLILGYDINMGLGIYPDSVSFIGSNENAYTMIGLQNTNIGDSIVVEVKFSGVGSTWGCGIYQNDLPNASSTSYLNNVGSGLKIGSSFIVEL